MISLKNVVWPNCMFVCACVFVGLSSTYHPNSTKWESSDVSHDRATGHEKLKYQEIRSNITTKHPLFFFAELRQWLHNWWSGYTSKGKGYTLDWTAPLICLQEFYHVWICMSTTVYQCICVYIMCVLIVFVVQR